MARVLSLFVALAMTGLAFPQAPVLKVHKNQRFLATADDQPFFWLADTAWELFHRTTREEATHYLDVRMKQGYNVVQVVAIAELDGHTTPNSYGHQPLQDLDPARPAVTDGPNNDYWDHVDFIVAEANRRGIIVALLPTWGRFWYDTKPNEKPIFSEANAARYGEWLGKRYTNSRIVWVLGGDRSVDNDTQRAILRAMATGLKKGDAGKHLMTFHPPGGQGSTKFFPDESWLDFHMRQNGHAIDYPGRYDQTLVDYRRNPIKPVLDGEPVYEDHPISFNAKTFGHTVAADVRRPLYWDLFSGACGHTYGHHSVWQMAGPGRPPINAPLLSWKEALLQPGAEQMQHAKALVLSRPYFSRIPDDGVIVPSEYTTAMPGAGRYRFCATRDREGSYAFIYAPVNRHFQVNLKEHSGATIQPWWFNPRTGAATKLAAFPRETPPRFQSP
ncbi:MAG: DUF4038 domain-containing protein, partial [Gemmataceae bacterium]